MFLTLIPYFFQDFCGHSRKYYACLALVDEFVAPESGGDAKAVAEMLVVAGGVGEGA